ncbi:MAG TPA: hypothetical protein VGQ71_03175 [Terriglobales bacterium]|nr:hypothetical protein [Terriglobales bacterium]
MAEQPPIKPEINPQSFGNREHKLPVRHRRADLLADPMGRLQRPFLMTARTKATAPTPKRHEKLVGALWTPHAREPLVQVTAGQKFLDRCVDSRPPEAVALLIALFIGRCKLRVKPLDQLIKGRLFGLARPVKAVWLVRAWHRGHSCGAAPMHTCQVKLWLAWEGKKVKEV